MAGGGRRRNKNEVYLHLIWTTQNRRPFLTPELEATLYPCIVQEARQRNCQVLAINGLPDHVHLVLKLATTTSISELVKQMKGVGASLARNVLGPDAYFRWEDHYAVFSVTNSHLRRVTTYVEEQKTRHTDGDLWPDWEESTYIEDDGLSGT